MGKGLIFGWIVLSRPWEIRLPAGRVKSPLV